MQLQFWQVLVLAVVQGLTEFLPISSSGHLVLVSWLLGADAGESPDIGDVNIVLHVGTLGAVVVFYFRRLIQLASDERRTLGLLLAGTLPAVAAGLPVKLLYEQILESPLVAGVLLIGTGIMLLVAGRLPRGERTCGELTWLQALAIGLAQAVAILPGISRSGATISTGLALGLSPRSAATFSFLLAIPTIGGAGLLQAVSYAGGGGGSTPAAWLLAGLVVSFSVGWLALAWLVRWLERGRLSDFAWWCIPVGLTVLAIQGAAWLGSNEKSPGAPHAPATGELHQAPTSPPA